MQMKTLAVLIGAAVAVQAAPSTEHANIARVKTSYSITQEPVGHKPAGWKALADVYAKYNKEMPTELQRVSAAATSGSVSASPEAYDQAYLSPVYIGTSSQKFLLDFDTGSSDLWVFSDKLATSQRGNHSSYHLTGTLQSGETWSIGYADGSGASGIVYADKVVIAGITATSQSVEAATSVSSGFVSDQADGLLGLSFDKSNTCTPKRCLTWTTTVAPQLARNLFAVTLKKGAAGTYDFGYIDTNKYTAPLVYTPVTSTLNGGGYYWEYAATGYSVGTGAAVSRAFTAIADTGTSLAIVDQAICTAYYAKVSGSSYNNSVGGYIFPCTATLPSLTIYINGGKNVIPGSYINYAPVGGNMCFGGLQPNTGIGFSVLGDVFLKAQYVVFDKGANRLGFAQQKGVTG